MNDLVQCPSCQRTLRLPNHNNQQVRCPACGTIFAPIASQTREPIDEEQGIRLKPAPSTSNRAANSSPFSSEDLEDDDSPSPFRRQDRPDTLPGYGITVAVVVMLLLTTLLGGIHLLITFFDVNPSIQLGPDEELLPFDCLTALIVLPTRVLFLIWMYRSYKNLLLFDVGGLRFSPGWAVGAFFVPFLNLVRPYHIVQEMWKVSDPERDESRFAWRRRRGAFVVFLWWMLFLFAAILSYATVADPNARGLLMLSVGVGLISDLSEIYVVWKLHSRQQAKYQRLLSDDEL